MMITRFHWQTYCA